MSDRKKAIETLKQLRLDYEEFYEEHDNEVTNAYDMAIASLETDEMYDLLYEEPEFCADCISRQAVIDEMEKRHAEGDCITKGFIKNMPSVTPQVPKTEDCISKADALKLNVYAPIAPIAEGENVHWEEIILTEELRKLPSVLPKADKPSGKWIRKMKSEIADSLEFWDYSPNNNPLARDILETVNTYCAKMESEDKE